jgi:beta-aspartyl-peptidase (threonine type)
MGTVGAVALDWLAIWRRHLHRRHDQQTARTRRRQPAAGRGMLCQQCQRGGLLHRHRRSFMRTLAAYDIAALMEYGQLSLTACERVVMEKLPALGGSGGLIAVDREGNVVLPFNSEGMYRAWCYAGDTPTIGIYRE